MEECKFCQYSARWASNLVKYRASRPEETPLTIQETTFAGTGRFRMVEGRVNREPKSLVKSTGPESNMCPETQFLTNPYLSFTKENNFQNYIRIITNIDKISNEMDMKRGNV